MSNSSNFTPSVQVIDVYNYTCSLGYLLLPAINEYTWNLKVRAALYLLGLFWCFLGVAQIADIFMAAIERITSKTRTVRISDPEAETGYIELELKVWNDTVANLSLLALGTSAPEILLSIIEIVGNNFESGELGPGTIVGSAAFNLLFISAICIACVPDGEVRRIASIKVFGVTAFTCVFAYVWMALVLLVITPNVVDIWEAVLTFLFFPTLIIVAYIADKDFCSKKGQKTDDDLVGIPMESEVKQTSSVTNGEVPTPENCFVYDGTEQEEKQPDPVTNGEVPTPENCFVYDGTEPEEKQPDPVTNGDVPNAEDGHVYDGDSKGEVVVESHQPQEKSRGGEMTKLARELGRVEGLSPEEAANILSRHISEETPHTRAWYRINAIRNLTGGRKLIPPVPADFQDVFEHVQLPDENRPQIDTVNVDVDHSDGGKFAVIEFTAAAVAVMENEGKVRLGIKRTGRMDIPATIRVETINGTALSGEDYKPFDSVVEFKKKEALREVFVEIVDDCEWEPDEFFFVKLKPENDTNCVLGPNSICEVTIINDDEPGVMAFAKPSFVIKETGLKALIPVVRLNGADGHVTVKWASKDITAVEGKDYSGKEGELAFDNQETTKNIIIPLFPSQKEERDESFQIELTESGGGATIGKISKTIVTIVNDEEFNGLVNRILNMTKANLDALELHKTTYVQQFVEAMNVNGGNIANASFMDYVLHFCTFFWKIVFAFIPPTHFLGGWPTFIISLGLIGLLTAIIGDLASIFGCLIGLEDSITAITLVAMGTSMPDTFASKTAAIMEKSADNSIGNVNGSNSVNVFLGLGLPWMMASIYHYMQGSVFRVKTGSLGFSVIIYSLVAIIGIAILVTRRMTPSIGAELGGPKCSKILCSIIFVLLWVFYVSISALQTKGIINVQIGA